MWRRRFIRTPFDSRRIPTVKPPDNTSAALQSRTPPIEVPDWANIPQSSCDSLLKTLPQLCDEAKEHLSKATFALDYYASRYATGNKQQAAAVTKLLTMTDAELGSWALAQTVDAGPRLVEESAKK